MKIHTAQWRMQQAHLVCGHTMTVRTGETLTFCSWCAETSAVTPVAA